MTNSKILSRLREINLLIVLDVILLILSLVWINYSDINVIIQNNFFDFMRDDWVIDKDEIVKKIFFYKLPKILLGCALVFMLYSIIMGFFKKKSGFFFKNRHKFLLTFIGIVCTLLIAGNIKKFTNVYCPNRLEIYGGDMPYVKIFQSYPEDFKQTKKPACFPSGHSVTGFCLFILFFVFDSKFLRVAGLFSAVIIGWIVGVYQMMKGYHFFGDTLVSMWVCFLIAALVAKFFYEKLEKTSLEK